jgi:hypothetical protein
MKAFLKIGLMAALMGVVACGGDDGGDDVTPTPDAKPAPDANVGPDAAPVCSVNMAGYQVGAIMGDATNMITLQHTAGMNENYNMGVAFNMDQDGFLLEMYKGFGVFQASIVPGTYQLTGAELNYATCGLCLRFFGNSTQGNPGQSFMATAGTVNITDLGPDGTGRFKATLSGVTFEHVTIDPMTFQSTPVNDGCTTSFSGDVTIDVPVVTAMKPGQPGSVKAPVFPDIVTRSGR